MIGIFDSGYGGLTILKEVVKILPHYDYLYLGDNARYPYGNRSKETVVQFTDEAVQYLFQRGCRLIIVACFTASALALREIQEKYLRSLKSPFKDRKILGVLLPVVEKAVAATKTRRIGVAATRGTVLSKSFEMELKKLQPKMEVFQQSCPLLVPLIEEHWHKKPETKIILRKYLSPLKSNHPDTLILGCTHYPFLAQDFRRMMGKNVAVINPPDIVAESLKKYLERHPEIESRLSRGNSRIFETTDESEKFREFLKTVFGERKFDVQKVNLARFHE